MAPVEDRSIQRASTRRAGETRPLMVEVLVRVKLMVSTKEVGVKNTLLTTPKSPSLSEPSVVVFAPLVVYEPVVITPVVVAPVVVTPAVVAPVIEIRPPSISIGVGVSVGAKVKHSHSHKKRGKGHYKHY